MNDNAPSQFSDLPLSPPILDAIRAAGYQTPTAVQGGVIPLVMAGIDLIVQSQTGSGKTAAFAIPLAETLDATPGVVQALVLTPTRELALQVTAEFRRLGCDERGLGVVTVYGGASIRDQIEGVKTAQVIIATPGRMLDLLRRRATSLENLKVFILDEADEMLSMGFERELDAIREFLPEERQSLMFSATVGEEIKTVAANTLFYPEYLSFSSDSIGAAEIAHYYYLVSGVGRMRDLHRLIEAEEPESALVFCNTRDDTFRVANFLKQQGHDADVLNGNLTQAEREKVMAQTKAGKLRFLVATDIAARGIDISFLPCVINYVLPESAESYIHRTGRTGRAGRAGCALSLISPKEIGMFYQLRRGYKLELESRDLPSDEALTALKYKRALDNILNGLDSAEDLDYGRFLTFADALPTLPDHRTRLAKLMAFYVRERDRLADAEKALAAQSVAVEAESADTPASAPPQRHEAVRVEDAGPVEDAAPVETAAGPTASERAEPEGAGKSNNRRRRRRSSPGDRRADRAPANGSEASSDAQTEANSEPQQKRRMRGPVMSKLRINIGREQIAAPDKLIDLIVELSGMDESDLGGAELLEDHAVVEVRRDLVEDIIAAVHRQRIDDHVLEVSR